MKRVSLLARRSRISILAQLIALTACAPAGVAQSPIVLTPQVRNAILDSIITSITNLYIDADTAKLIAAHMRAQSAKHAYDAMTNPLQFGDAVTRDLRAINNDLHLGLRYSVAPQATAQPSGATPEQQRLVNYGMGRAEILPGNVGYLEITGFVGGDYEDAVVDALRFLSRTDALIIDLRRNGGGDAAMNNFVLSHFLGPKPVATVNVRTRRATDTRHDMSLADVPGPRRTDMPLYILTSRATASAAEAFTFVLHNHKRAITVGTRTAGAGHMVKRVPVGYGFEVGISITRVSDPATGKEWEAVGVPADISATPETALDVAHAAALRALLTRSSLTPVRVRTLKQYVETIEARLHGTAVSSVRLNRLAGSYGSLVMTAHDGTLWYARVAGALPEALVPLGGDTFALGAIRFRFTEQGGTVRVTIEQPDGTSLTLDRSH